MSGGEWIDDDGDPFRHPAGVSGLVRDRIRELVAVQGATSVVVLTHRSTLEALAAHVPEDIRYMCLDDEDEFGLRFPLWHGCPVLYLVSQDVEDVVFIVDARQFEMVKWRGDTSGWRYVPLKREALK